MTQPIGPPLMLEAEAADAGTRLDRFLTAKVEGLSRSRVQGLIRTGHVKTAAGTIVDPGARVKRGDRFELSLPPPEPAEPLPEPMALAVAYEDRHLIVIDKPAGLVVHPAAGHGAGTLVNALIAHCGDSLSGIGGVRRPGIVHRLDKDTSGLLVIAKTDAAHQGLAEQFAAHGLDGRLERAYLGFAWGVPRRPRGTIDAPLGRSATNRTKIAVQRGAFGRRAVTHYELRDTFLAEDGRPTACFLRLRLETGRTHQIRVHLAHIGHPLMGDRTYGAGLVTRAAVLTTGARTALAKLSRQALHAYLLAFEHPVTGRGMRFESALPPDLTRLQAELARG